ncbi:PEPxxWA-CTERM sorting domain-containing protein [Novosphingobium sp. G106]|uniref:PEPxxWA-CTERM sorting domain-containing protein n=1 Tax=Novosphingobium sp. G106 TaxID=2849500 RepID=UPI001C2DCC14|nr:PEPxxWA-CTERM sorting domain-containing protein [Novosphingobium sp. G106]MBV1690487.1 PEPxxWA-CTERM sorting domain-containing protein [Novosphingobium sp. G106]
MMAVALSCSLAAFSAPALAVDVVDGFTLDSGSFGTGFGVHSDGTQTGPTLNAHVNIDGSAVTFGSTGGLTMTGGGEATVYPDGGVIDDLTVDFAKSWNKITFSFDGEEDGIFTLLVNGASLFDGCLLCTLDSSGQNKFILTGSGINSLAFTFDPGILTAKQFRVDGVTDAVPEPATWGLMILGIGVAGAAMRRRQRQRIRYHLA